MSKKIFEKAIKIPGVIWGSIILIIIFTIFAPNFATFASIINILKNSSILLLVSSGMTLAILSKQIDISVGGVATLSGMISGVFLKSVNDNGFNIVLAMIIGIMVGILCGLVNSILIAIFNYNYWLVTFSTMSIAFGLSQIVTKGSIVSGFSRNVRNLTNFEIFHIPLLIFIVLTIVLIMIYINYKTPFGYHIFAIGDSEVCAKNSGIHVRKVRFIIYIISGALAGLGGVLLMSKTNSASPISGSGYEFDAIAATIIGGTSFEGGRGGIKGTALGAIMLSAIKSGLQLIGFSLYVQQVFIGVFILMIIIVDVLSSNKREDNKLKRVYK